MSEHTHEAVWVVLERLANQPPHVDHLRQYDSIEEVFGRHLGTDRDARRLVARAWLEKARTLAMLGRAAEAEALSDRLEAAFATDPDPAVRRTVCRALFGKAQGQQDGDPTYRRIEAIAAHPPAVPGLAAEAVYNRGVTRELMNARLDEAKQIYVELIDAQGESDDFEVRRWVDEAAFGICRIEFPALVKGDDVTPVIDRYAADASWRRQYLAAQALLVVGNRFMKRQQGVDAAAMFARAHELFGRHPAAPVRAVVASAMMNRALALGQARGSDAELRAYDELFAAHGDATEPVVRRWVAAAERNAALELQSRGDPAAMCQRLERLLHRFGDDPGPAPLLREVASARAMLAKARRRP